MKMFEKVAKALNKFPIFLTLPLLLQIKFVPTQLASISISSPILISYTRSHYKLNPRAYCQYINAKAMTLSNTHLSNIPHSSTLNTLLSYKDRRCPYKACLVIGDIFTLFSLNSAAMLIHNMPVD